MKHKTCTEYWLDTSEMKLRGDFEGMYADIKDPWGCFQGTSSLDNRIFLELLFENKVAFSSILDIGCGLGGFTNLVNKRNGEKGVVYGCDISSTAIKKALEQFPEIVFTEKNILTDQFDDMPNFELVILSEVLWYLLDDLEKVFYTIRQKLVGNGYFAIHQYFPFDQKFGRDKINGIRGFEKFVESQKTFTLKHKIVSHHAKEGEVLLAMYQYKQ